MQVILVSEVILMKKKNMNEWFKGKGFYISLMAGAICVVAVAAVTLDSFGINKNMSGEKEKNDIAKNIVEKPQEYDMDELAELEDITKYPVDIPTQIPQINSENKKADEIAQLPEVTEKPDDEKEVDSKTTEKNKENNKTADEKHKKQSKQQQKVAVMNNDKKISSLKFDQEAGMSWPVNGDIIMKYSADNVVYHKTLGQYKSNPALVISAGEGSNVSCSVDGIVTEVGKNEEIGNYVETAVGDEYKIIYGGLENVQVKKGETINQGELIGVIAEPTKYYIEEGANLYLKMTCKNETVDPMIFLE